MTVQQQRVHPGGVQQVQDGARALQVEDVFKIYKEGPIETVALRGASLQIEAGDLVAMLGRSGSGKSTLLNLIAGLDVPSAGRIRLAGQEITNLDPGARAAVRRRELGIVLQSGNLVPFLSAQENVELPMLLDGVDAATARKRAVELLTGVGLGTRIGHRAGQLSGGEEQRVAIACALANNPALILADELTGELDSATAQAILDLLEETNRQQHTAFLLVTHNEEVAARARRVVRIVDGAVQEDTHAA
ncbi:MAG: lipoprotein-releasing ABC transporter ATP-binding protein LolD [Chloroflexota bacterium]